MSRNRLAAAVACGVLLALAVPVAAAAQTRFVLSPTIGVYAPMNDLVNSVINGEEVVLKQDVGIAVGGRASLFLGRRVSLSATGSYVPSELQATINDSGFDTSQDKSNLWFGSARLNFWILPPTSPLYLGVGGGVGLAGRGALTITTPGGQTLTQPSSTDVGGVISGTIGVNLGGLGLFLSVDDYIYNPSVFAEADPGSSPTQNDLQLNIGFGVPLGGTSSR